MGENAGGKPTPNNIRTVLHVYDPVSRPVASLANYPNSRFPWATWCPPLATARGKPTPGLKPTPADWKSRPTNPPQKSHHKRPRLQQKIPAQRHLNSWRPSQKISTTESQLHCPMSYHQVSPVIYQIIQSISCHQVQFLQKLEPQA